MLRRLPPLNSLRAFEVVSRHGSFRAAAEELHVTAAAVSQATMASGRHRVLTVSAVPSLAAGWLVPRLHRFREQYPELDVLLHASQELVDLEHSRVDLGIRYGSGRYPGLISERLFVDEIFPVYSPGMLKGRAPLKMPGDLRAAEITGIDVTKGLQFSDGALVIQAAVNDDF